MLGYATSGAALSTMGYAADLDYRLMVVEDTCTDQDPEAHEFLCQRILPRQVGLVGPEAVLLALAG